MRGNAFFQALMKGLRSQLPLVSPAYSTLLVPKLENSLWQTWNRDGCYDNKWNIFWEHCWCWVYKYTSLISYNLEIVIKVVSVLVHHSNIFVQLTVLGLWRGWQDDKSHAKNHHIQNLTATYQIVAFSSAVSWVPKRETVPMLASTPDLLAGDITLRNTTL